MYTYFLAQHLNSDLSLESYTQWPKLHRPKAKHNTTQLQTPPWPITNTISSKITTTTTTVLTASPSPNAPPPPSLPPPIPTHPPLQDSTLSTHSLHHLHLRLQPHQNTASPLSLPSPPIPNPSPRVPELNPDRREQRGALDVVDDDPRLGGI